MSGLEFPNYRTWGATKNCKGCRFWSEMCASYRNGRMEALCCAIDGPKSGKFTTEQVTCDKWQEGSLGAIDDPGGNPYNESTHAMTIPTPTPHDAMTAEDFSRLAELYTGAHPDIRAGLYAAAAQARTLARIREEIANAPIGIWEGYYERFCMPWSSGTPIPRFYENMQYAMVKLPLRSLLADGEG